MQMPVMAIAVFMARVIALAPHSVKAESAGRRARTLQKCIVRRRVMIS